MATTHTRFGKFLNHYRALDRARKLPSTPVILSEGDSWFSTPLYYNLVDWLEVDAPAALFMRMESSGDLALKMFQGGNLKELRSRLNALNFDILLISAGGNDFVDEFLRDTFRKTGRMTPEQALQTVINTGRYEAVYEAYCRMLNTAFETRPQLQVITHTYDYPRLMGQQGVLTVENIGLAALLKRQVGDWIARYLTHVLDAAQQREFAKLLIDQFSVRVLNRLANDPRYRGKLSVVDFRGQLTSDADWNDEMHPTGAAFRRLALHLRAKVREVLPPAKRAGIG